MNDPGFRYYLITDRRKCYPKPLPDVVAEACRAGIRAVQLREKDLPAKELFQLAAELRTITRRWRAKLFINDRTDIALAVDADGVHCRENGVGPSTVKKFFPSLAAGSSVHSLASALEAEKEGADFLLFGPVFLTASKVRYGSPQGVAALREVAGSVGLPVFAVGGVDAKRASACRSAGAFGVAGISSIIAAESVEQKVKHWKSTLKKL